LQDCLGPSVDSWTVQFASILTPNNQFPFCEREEKTGSCTRSHTQAMIFLAAFNDTPASDSAFSSRGEPKLKQGPVSSANVVVFPTVRQDAYFGYEKNIDAFLAATGTGKELPLADQFYHVGDVAITFPLSIPSANISFKVTDKALLKRILDRMAEVTTVEKITGVGKHPNAYTVEKPTWKMVDNLVEVAHDDPPKTTGKTTFGALKWMKHVYNMVELYLRTNTYPAFRGEEEDDEVAPRFNVRQKRQLTLAEMLECATKKTRYSTVNMTHTPVGDENGKKFKEDGAWFGQQSDADVEFLVEMEDTPVFKARPSPAANSKRSWSSPSQAPAMPGILFPYFPGMNSPDARYIRSTICDYYLRCFENKEDWTEFRTEVSGFASTMEGIILAHILKGVEISLKAQGQLHLLFDGADYLGFVVFGSKWLIQFGNRWYSPLSVTELQAELRTIKTHQSSLDELRALLAEHSVILQDSGVTPVKVAEALAKVEWPGDEEEAAKEQKKFEALVGRLDFGTRAVGAGAESFLEALQHITNVEVSLGDQHIHFPPPTEYHLLSTRAGLVLSRFGSRIPSTGIFKVEKEIRVTENHSSAAKDSVRKASLEDIPSVLIALKPLENALKDFNLLKSKQKLCISSKERAANYRHITFGKASKDKFVVGVADLIKLWGVSQTSDEGPPVASGSKDKGKKRKLDEATFAVNF